MPKPKAWTSLAAALAVAAALPLAACGGELDDSELDRYLCNEELFGPGAHEAARGELTAADLEDMAGGKGQPPTEMKAGKFAIYAWELPRPPFDPPGDIVCQAVEFESESAAVAWVQGLDYLQPLDGMVVGFLAEGGFHGEETVLPGAPAESHLRVFLAQPGSERGLVTIAVGVEGRIVRTLAFSGGQLIDPQTETVATWWVEASPD